MQNVSFGGIVQKSAGNSGIWAFGKVWFDQSEERRATPPTRISQPIAHQPVYSIPAPAQFQGSGGSCTTRKYRPVSGAPVIDTGTEVRMSVATTSNKGCQTGRSNESVYSTP